MQFDYDARLDGLLSSIEATLIAELPAAIRRLSIAEPCYALFIWYEDSGVDDFAPLFGIGTQSVLDACEVQYSSDADSRIGCIWSPQQTLEDSDLIRRHSIDKPGFSEQCNSAYSLMLAANKSELPLDDESVILLPFRSMLYRVASKLTDADWTGILRTDDRFVVVASDCTGYWLSDDFEACVPSRKRKLLEKQGLWPA